MTSAVATPSFRCVYCGHTGPGSDFDNEHVFSRSLCGSGDNWTLVDRVCKTCNSRFSRFESELLQQAAETVARGFSGPLGRSAGGTRVQPLKINHLYLLNQNDPLVYEAGFSFPAQHYFRPQMIDVGDGTILSMITDRSELAPFEQAVSGFVRDTRITLPRPPNRREYEIVTYEDVGGRWHAKSRNLSRTPSGVFFREFIRRPQLPPMTPRLAQNDDGKLFVRAADLDEVGRFMDAMFANRQAAPRPPLPPGPGNQTVLFAVQVDLIKVYKAILKTGLNLVAHFYGDEVLRGGAFDRARGIVLEDVATDDAARICRMSPGFPADFPKAGVDAHQLMLDECDGSLRFRMRLYNSFGYTAMLAPLSATLREGVGPSIPRRVLIEYATTGIREVTVWP